MSIRVLVLQHPQEPGETRGSAGLVPQCLEGAEVKVGLSWPNLARALGEQADPKKWVVLYLGSGVKNEAGNTNQVKPLEGRYGSLVFVDKKGRPVGVKREDIEGLLILDGTWSQAKTMWWRNAWLLKLRRAVLVPKVRSLYGALRREPRKECLSTVESVAVALSALGASEGVTEALFSSFKDFLKQATSRP
jgi:DTW domain-containing protein YfiP